MDISSVILGITHQQNPVGSRTSDDSTTHLPLFESVDFTLLDIFKLGITRDIDQVRVLPRHNASSQTLSYALGSGLTCEVTRHELREGDVRSSQKVRPGQVVALKRYSSTDARDDHSPEKHIAQVWRLLSQELRVFCHPQLKEHPNILCLECIGWEMDSLIPVLGLELAAYGTLDDFFSSADLSSNKHTITDWERFRATADITYGLQALHNCGFVHGDLKPGNVLVQQHQELGLCCKLADFSGACQSSQKNISVPYERHGTPLWMAPEELSGKAISDWCMSDVYSYGLLIVSLWHNGCSKLGRPIDCYLALHISKDDRPNELSAFSRNISNDVMSKVNALKILEDDNKSSPSRLVMSDFAEHHYSSIFSSIAHHSLLLSPGNRFDISTIIECFGSDLISMFDMKDSV